VYVYRDTEDRPNDQAPSGPDAHDASYWYDLSGQDGTPAKDAAPAAQPTRGPFEPLVSSGDTPSDGDMPPAAAPAADTAAPQDAAATAQTPGGGGKHAASSSEGAPDSGLTQARRLEQIKDFYLTAEAIGERNVDKHFDQLLAQQRELISEYFKRPSTARPGDGPTQAAPEAANPERPDPPASSTGHPSNPQNPPSSASVIAEHPQVW
jgi:hypothetical protein